MYLVVIACNCMECLFKDTGETVTLVVQERTRQQVYFTVYPFVLLNCVLQVLCVQKNTEN